MKIDKRKTKEISTEELRDFFTASILFESSWDNLSKYYYDGENFINKRLSPVGVLCNFFY